MKKPYLTQYERQLIMWHTVMGEPLLLNLKYKIFCRNIHKKYKSMFKKNKPAAIPKHKIQVKYEVSNLIQKANIPSDIKQKYILKELGERVFNELIKNNLLHININEAQEGQLIITISFQTIGHSAQSNLLKIIQPYIQGYHETN